jgi:hypothetical protein
MTCPTLFTLPLLVLKVQLLGATISTLLGDRLPTLTLLEAILRMFLGAKVPPLLVAALPLLVLLLRVLTSDDSALRQAVTIVTTNR